MWCSIADSVYPVSYGGTQLNFFGDGMVDPYGAPVGIPQPSMAPGPGHHFSTYPYGIKMK